MRWRTGRAALLSVLTLSLWAVASACASTTEPAVLGVAETRASTSTAAITTAPSTTTTIDGDDPVETTTAKSAPPDSTTTGPSVSVTDAPPESADRGGLGAEAEALISYSFRSALPGWSITYSPEREDVRGLTFPGSKRIEIYIRPGDTAATVARVLAHELGHALDVEHNSDDDRQQWRDTRGIDPSVSWWPTETTFDFDTAAGDWAEAFAVWQTGATNQTNIAGNLGADDIGVMQSILP